MSKSHIGSCLYSSGQLCNVCAHRLLRQFEKKRLMRKVEHDLDLILAMITEQQPIKCGTLFFRSEQLLTNASSVHNKRMAQYFCARQV